MAAATDVQMSLAVESAIKAKAPAAAMEKHNEKIAKLTAEITHSFEKLDRVDVRAWREDGRKLLDSMQKLASELDALEANVGAAKVAGGSAAVLGGALCLIGMAGAVFSFGLTLSLVAAGVAVGTAGGLTSAGGEITKFVMLKSKLENLRKESDLFSEKTEHLQDVLNELLGLLEQLFDVLNHISFELLDESMPNFKSLPKPELLNYLRAGKSIVMSVVRTALAGNRLVKIARIGIAVNYLSKSVIFSEQFMKLAAGIIAAPGRSVPMWVQKLPILNRVSLLKPDVIVEAASLSAKLLQGTFALLTIGSGVWDVVDGVQSLSEGSHAAKVVRESMEDIEQTVSLFNEALEALYETEKLA